LNRRRVRIILLAFATALLFALLFVQQAFNTLQWLVPSSASETLILYALSTINFVAFIVLLMVLVRNLIKLRRELQQGRLGARFKTRLVVFFIALSLLPVLFLFFATYGLINRSVDKWFSLPAREMVKNAREIQGAYVAGEQESLARTTRLLGRLLARAPEEETARALELEFASQDLVRAEVYAANGARLAARSSGEEFGAEFERAWSAAVAARAASSTQVSEGFKPVYLIA
jgi:nitrogen fixation/metabolism regulation signal transduction histidine kinase